MIDTFEDAIRLGVEIAEDRARLREKEARFAALMGKPTAGPGAGAIVSAIAQSPEAVSKAPSAASRIRDFFAKHPGRRIHVSEIFVGVPGLTQSCVNSTTNRLATAKSGNLPGLRSDDERGWYVYEPKAKETSE